MLVRRSEQEHRKQGDSENAGVHAFSSDDVDITEEDSHGAAIVGKKSAFGFWIVGVSARDRSSHIKRRKRCSSPHPHGRAAVSSRRMLKRKPGRPPKALALAAAGRVTVDAPPPELHADSHPRPSVTLSRCPAGVPSGCWFWLQGNSDSVPTARDGMSSGVMWNRLCRRAAHKPKASQQKTAKAASDEGASKTTGLRHGRLPGSQNKPRTVHAVMQTAEVQAKP
eukprot:364173-Chlamydomonas_euryale.AAC.4